MELRTSIEHAISGTLAADLTTDTATEVIAAQGANNRVNLTTIVITNSHATVGTVVQILDGTTVKARIYAAPVGGGAAITLPTPIRGSADTAWKVKCETSGASVQAFLSGFKWAR